MNRLTQILKDSIDEFRYLSISSVNDGTRIVPTSSLNDDGEVKVKKSTLRNAIGGICPSRRIENYKTDFLSHFSELKNYLTFCSSPKSFRTAWDLRSEILNPFDANKLTNEGGQLIPLNNKTRVFKCEQQGVLYGVNKRLILGVRHSEGNYDDKLDDLGQFTYQPPKDVSGFLRYRWCHFLSERLQVPYVLLVIIWFEFRVNDDINHVFIIAPAKIVNGPRELNNLDTSLHKPLKLQLINREEAFNTLLVLQSLKEDIGDLETRFELPDTFAREWSYDKINNTEKGRKIKRWARSTGKRCPGDICEQQPFENINPSRIAFGHIISQNWSRAFTYLLSSVDHPDNLYLTCSKCNSSLGDRFPASELRSEITKIGTIGDWLRKNEKEIRKS